MHQPSRPRGWLLTALLAGGVLLLSCCGGGGALWFTAGKSVGLEGKLRVADGSAPAAARPAPLSPEAYQQALTGVDAALAPPFQQLAAAAARPALTQALESAAGTMRTEIAGLSELTPPTFLDRVHRDLVNHLTRLREEVVTAGAGNGAEGRPCTGFALISQLSRSTAATVVRTTAQELKTADPARPYTFGAFLPAPSGPFERRLGNGAFVKRTAKGGLGQLKIENGQGVDAAVTVVPANTTTPVITVYVHAGNNTTVKNVPDGTYRFYLTSGKDWDAGARAFTRDCEFEKFEDSFAFTTTRRTFSIWTISLAATIGGNARTSPVDPGAFPTG